MFQKQVQSFIAIWNGADLEGLDAIAATNIVRRGPSVSMPAKNIEELKEVIKSMRAAFPDLELTLDDAAYVGDHAFVRWTFKGTNTGPGQFPPTGKPVKVTGMSLVRYASGKAVEEDVYFDSLDMLTQLGLAQSPIAP
jgi:predicted ester cyclase